MHSISPPIHSRCSFISQGLPPSTLPVCLSFCRDWSVCGIVWSASVKNHLFSTYYHVTHISTPPPPHRNNFHIKTSPATTVPNEGSPPIKFTMIWNPSPPEAHEWVKIFNSETLRTDHDQQCNQRDYLRRLTVPGTKQLENHLWQYPHFAPSGPWLRRHNTEWIYMKLVLPDNLQS